MDALRRSPPFTTGGWTWIYNSAATIRQGAKKGTDDTVLKTKLLQLDRPLQDSLRRPGTGLRHPRWPAPSRPTITPSDRPHQSVLNSFSTTSPPSHVTVDVISPPPERLEIDQITEHQLVRETHWAGLLSPSWEDERDLRPIGPTSFAIGRAPPRTTARPTANTANESPHGRGCTFRLKCF